MPYSLRGSTIAKTYISKYNIKPWVAQKIANAFGANVEIRKSNAYYDFEIRIQKQWYSIELKNIQ
jgi:hypothetical protein